jgi:predicted Zn-dependent protease
VDHTELQIMTGRCLTRLGQPLAAIPVLHRALAGFDDAQARDKALYMSWLAEAYLNAGEIGTAAAVASDVLALSAGIASARPAQRLRVLVARLEGQSAVPAVAALLDQVCSVMPTTMRPG